MELFLYDANTHFYVMLYSYFIWSQLFIYVFLWIHKKIWSKLNSTFPSSIIWNGTDTVIKDDKWERMMKSCCLMNCRMPWSIFTLIIWSPKLNCQTGGHCSRLVATVSDFGQAIQYFLSNGFLIFTMESIITYNISIFGGVLLI